MLSVYLHQVRSPKIDRVGKIFYMSAAVNSEVNMQTEKTAMFKTIRSCKLHREVLNKRTCKTLFHANYDFHV